MTRVSLPANLRSLYENAPTNQNEILLQKQGSTRKIKGLLQQLQRYTKLPNNVMKNVGDFQIGLNNIDINANKLISLLGYEKAAREDYPNMLIEQKKFFEKKVTIINEIAPSFIGSTNITTSQIKKDAALQGKIKDFRDMFLGTSNSLVQIKQKKVPLTGKPKNSKQAQQKKVKQIIAETKPIDTNTQPEFASFNHLKIEFQKLVDKANTECWRLDKNIKKYAASPVPKEEILAALGLRARKTISADDLKEIMAESQQKDTDRIGKFEKLKKCMNDSQLECNKVEILGNQIKWMGEIMPELNEYSEMLPQLSTEITSQMKLFETLHADNFFTDFVKKADLGKNTNLTELEEQLTKHNLELSKQFEAHKSNATKMNKLETKVKDLEDFGKKFIHTLNDTLTEITDTINKTKKIDYNNLIDPDAIAQLNQQKEMAILTYEGIRSEIVNKSNNFFLELYGLKQLVVMFNKLINPSVKLTDLCIQLKNEYQTLRNTRLKANLQTLHQAAFDKQIESFKETLNIMKDKVVKDFYVSTSTDWADDIFVQDDLLSSRFTPQKVKSEPGLSNEMNDLKSKKYDMFLQSAKSIGLTGRDDVRDQLLIKQNESLKVKLEDYKQKLRDAYTITLQNLCNIVCVEVDRIGKTLKLHPTGYENNFNEAYNYETAILDSAQTAITIVYKKYKGEKTELYTSVETPFVPLIEEKK